MTLRKHLREAEREDLGEIIMQISRRGAQNKRFDHACYFSRSVPAPNTPYLAVPCDRTTARNHTSAPLPKHDITQMVGGETVHESMSSGRSCR